MRAAGCAYNDIVDRNLDAKVARTAGRPVASGRISVQQAWAYLVVCSLLAAAILFTLPPLAIGLGIGSLLLVAAYPFMKRITWWPQAWLGLTFNWGALLGFAAVTGEIGLPAVLLYLGGVFWTLGYDTIYAVQDMEDDALAGIRSSARRLGPSAPKAVLGVYVLAFLLALACAFTARLGPLFPPLAAGYGLHLSRQAARLDMGDPAGALALFRSNALAGLILFAALAAGRFGQGLWGGGGL
jgi:4-hydroxybenzoate polyprenyltransferase